MTNELMTATESITLPELPKRRSGNRSVPAFSEFLRIDCGGQDFGGRFLELGKTERLPGRQGSRLPVFPSQAWDPTDGSVGKVDDRNGHVC